MMAEQKLHELFYEICEQAEKEAIASLFNLSLLAGITKEGLVFIYDEGYKFNEIDARIPWDHIDIDYDAVLILLEWVHRKFGGYTCEVSEDLTLYQKIELKSKILNAIDNLREKVLKSCVS